MEQNAKVQSYVNTAWQRAGMPTWTPKWPWSKSVALPSYPQEPSPKGKMLGLGSGPCSCARGGSECVCELQRAEGGKLIIVSTKKRDFVEKMIY